MQLVNIWITQKGFISHISQTLVELVPEYVQNFGP